MEPEDEVTRLKGMINSLLWAQGNPKLTLQEAEERAVEILAVMTRPAGEGPGYLAEAWRQGRFAETLAAFVLRPPEETGPCLHAVAHTHLVRLESLIRAELAIPPGDRATTGRWGDGA